MTRKQFALIAAVCGAVAFISALMPWVTAPTPDFSGVPEGMRGFAEQMAAKMPSISGTEGGLKGTWVIVLGLLGGFHALLVHLGKHKQVLGFLPFDERQHLFVSTALFALACILTLTDFMSSGFEHASRGIGIWLALLSTAGGAAIAFLATMKPASGPPAAS